MKAPPLIISLLIFISLFLLVILITTAVVFAPIYHPVTAQNINQVAAVAGQSEIKSVPKIATTTTTTTTTTIIFGGDAMLSRVVNQKMEQYRDWTWPFKKISSQMSLADLTVINLESPMTIGGDHLVKTGSFSFKADPQSIAGLKLAGVDVVSLANNHMLNQGSKGVSDTQKILTENQIGFVGAGLNELSAREPLIKEINQLKFGFLAYAYPNDSSVATINTPGIANLDLKKMTADVSGLKKQVDVVIVLMHAGTEYKNTSNWQQQEFARQAIDAGADLVVGHHPHWVQNIEIYKNKPILYSLGNLVFDQMWSQETQEGALAKVEWTNKTISRIEIKPVLIKGYGQAEIATSTDAIKTILKRMGQKSSLVELPSI